MDGQCAQFWDFILLQLQLFTLRIFKMRTFSSRSINIETIVTVVGSRRGPILFPFGLKRSYILLPSLLVRKVPCTKLYLSVVIIQQFVWLCHMRFSKGCRIIRHPCCKFQTLRCASIQVSCIGVAADMQLWLYMLSYIFSAITPCLEVRLPNFHPRIGHTDEENFSFDFQVYILLNLLMSMEMFQCSLMKFFKLEAFACCILFCVVLCKCALLLFL